MSNFADWLAASAGMQQATQTLQQQFRLSERELREAVDALAPAMIIGFKRLYANQAAFADIARRFSGMPAGSDPAGQAAMQGLFGSNALTEAIARQASMMSGLAPDTLTSMMPTLSAMTMQAFMRNAGAAGSLFGAAPPDAMPGDAAGAMLAEMMRRSANAVEAFHRPSQRAKAPPLPGEAMAQMFGQALKGFPWPFMPVDGGASAPDKPEPKAGPREAEPQGERQERQATPLDAAFGMFEAGRNIQAGYIREMMSIFDRHPDAKNGDSSK